MSTLCMLYRELMFLTAHFYGKTSSGYVCMYVCMYVCRYVGM